MSALGSILAAVEEKVRALLASAGVHEAEQDARLDLIEERLDALETPPPSAKPAARQTVAAKAQTATGKGGAS